ncbi:MULTISPECIES: hypothetical protein [unclassified Streptomyces]|uniref:hypothetical protein n=1 Tax=unclassified Streptomyces TaxID=2593676 RepID=UPI0036EFA1E2
MTAPLPPDPAQGEGRVGTLRRPPDPTALRPTDPVTLRALVLPTGPDTAAHRDGLAHESRTQRPD